MMFKIIQSILESVWSEFSIFSLFAFSFHLLVIWLNIYFRFKAANNRRSSDTCPLGFDRKILAWSDTVTGYLWSYVEII